MPLFTIAGKRYDLTRQGVLAKMEGVQPERVRKYAVKLKGELFPLNQVLSVATGLPRAYINSQQAVSILRQLGFDIIAGE